MTEKVSTQVPVEISLHSKSRLLVVVFSNGIRFELPCEYLRVFSPAKEVRSQLTPTTGKENVNIIRIEPQGQYAVRLVFDDGHDTGIYSWDTLYQLGKQQSENWRGYLDKLEALGLSRQIAPGSAEKPRTIKLLYFTYLVKKLRKESETQELPDTVEDVRTLLDWLAKRRHEHAHLFDLNHVQVTVNKQFSEPFTRIEDGDEIALIPRSPIAPTAK
ncbi:MAG: DUF971 domain-containing protein [Gammaproteobacteria bacterium]|nr:DUF971 domain-containing protein [Gammaproteobacteria bacterium]